MRVRDAAMLAWKNVKVFSRQSLKMVLTMGVVFGLILAMEFWFQGIKNTYSKFANIATDGRVIMTLSSDVDDIGIELEKAMNTEEMLRDVETYGAVIGKAETYKMLYGSVVLEERLVKESIEVDLDEVPEDAVPILVSTFLGEQMSGYSYSERAVRSPEQKMEAYEKYRDGVVGKVFVYGDVKYFVVGLAPGSFHMADLSTRSMSGGKASLPDVVLEWISLPRDETIVVNNGEAWGREIETVEDKYVVIFDNIDKAYEFFEKGKGFFFGASLEGRQYVVEVVAGMSPVVVMEIKRLQVIIDIVCVILAVVAITIVVLTSIRLVDNNKRNIQLYYNLGATRKQIRTVYMGYFLWLMLSVAVVAVLIAVVIVTVYSWLNQTMLQTMFVTAFSLANLSRIMLMGVNLEVVGFLMLILLMVPVCVAVNRKGMSGRNGQKR